MFLGGKGPPPAESPQASPWLLPVVCQHLEDVTCTLGSYTHHPSRESQSQQCLSQLLTACPVPPLPPEGGQELEVRGSLASVSCQVPDNKRSRRNVSYAVVLLVPGLASVSEGLLHPGETRGGVWSNTHDTWVPDAQRALSTQEMKSFSF
ncbi:hypothetical protein MJG53_011184 [Ovis ammon polii x Ovis aries]|uniref:Uncharacterized protein n=2 Tax=Ovis TaxID=9935 RepID=A0A835ZZN0_SHEEP|nr:hypothetical protein JEQ12_003792 [Ovis aries]KAI4563172.1 hypothetical protein MJT46_010781 [Ovis ammon polii x Ovis aries]KAI4578329.1 hypothetical protein MJG53_011184 [Ovis ammon polii x Ovis aries]